MSVTTGVLLAQVGTPDAPTTAAVRRYLARFLSDPRVVDLPRWRWLPILHGIVLRTRPRKVAALYRRIWTDEGSPLLVTTRRQAAGLAERLGPGFRVEFGLRCSAPSIAEALDRLDDRRCDPIVVVPLFPQFSSATTASVFDAVAEWARGRRSIPSLRFVRSFADHPRWIAAVAGRVREAGVVPSPASPLLLSFHGIPTRYARSGDPYPAECAATARALVAELGLPDGCWRLAFQSRFGREEWLKPYAFETLASLPAQGIRSVSVLCASFAADCLETIDEMGREGERIFREAGGESYRLVECPNASAAAIEALASIVSQNAASPPEDSR
jgi:ferrochelatase